jgi:uncharacterized protein
MDIAYPFRVDGRGRTAPAENYDRHVHHMIEQVLFTSPGERVMRPDFGSGLLQLVFSPNSAEVAAATQFLVQGALQQWLGDLIQVSAVQIDQFEGTLTISIDYMLRRDGRSGSATFTREV